MRKQELLSIIQLITSLRDHIDQRFDHVDRRLDYLTWEQKAGSEVDAHTHPEGE